MDPLPGGDADVVSRYCVLKVAVKTGDPVAARMTWDIAFPSLQEAHTYCVPAGPGCGEVVEIV